MAVVEAHRVTLYCNGPTTSSRHKENIFTPVPPPLHLVALLITFL